MARGDWDGFSDVDLLALAPTQADASELADALVSAGLGDDVIGLSESRWQQLQASGDPYWAAIRRDAIPSPQGGFLNREVALGKAP